MKLISIRLCNFRQFYGQTPEIVLASGERNSTVIHGNNGAGKTTLMNAFTWVLYDKFSAAFAASEYLVNKRAITESEPGKPVLCWVEIVFQHDNKRYQVKRVCRAYKNNKDIEQSPSALYMQVAGDDGRWTIPPQHPDDIINRILPLSLHQYFFFDGERIEQIVRDDKKAEIAEATKELLGVEVLNRAIKHLGEARKSLETDLSLIGDAETKKYIKDKKKAEQEKERLIKRQAEIEQELEHQNELKRTLSSRLLDLKGAGELQKLRDELEQQAKLIREQLQQANQTIRREISTRGYTVFLSESILKFREKFQQLRESGELQTGITQQFIRDLLHQNNCICGSELIPGTPNREKVESWLGKAGVADIEETAIRMSSQVDEIEKRVPEFWQKVDQQQANLNQNRTELSRIETQLDDVKKKLRNFPDEDIQQLQKRLDEVETKINNLNRETGSNQQQIETANNSVSQLEKQIDKQKMNEMKQVLAQRRIEKTQDAISRLTQIKDRLDQQFRSQLEDRVQHIFSQISFTPYLPKLTDKYELRLVETTAGDEAEVAASTGENQILSLSFIGGIIEGVREWSQKNTLMGPDSSTFPIVMDSPFGSLDEIYRRQIAKIIPQLANQLIVLVTKTQWRGEVAQEMEKRIGKEYILSYNSPKTDCDEDFIELGGVRYPLVKHSPNEFEYTEILEVTYEF
ncbi:AAA family ATPase [Capilliphycus salinus ALCB114379]|uniref:AAA family ATPase n=1 Tax=Capilliphycus salinus TaxID=2768948 RepID=UPI0039A584C8